jgi:hypothetical protein
VQFLKRLTVHDVWLDALILSGLLVFSAFLLGYYQLFALLIAADPTYLSVSMLLLYVLASMRWLQLCYQLSRYQQTLNQPEASAREAGFQARALINASMPAATASDQLPLTALAEHLENRHALGYFISDLLLKLGLVGTVIGFILMLSPIAEMESFESNNIRNLLTAMSSGMAVALFTTLTGLITSTLLKVQYFLADSAVVQIIDTLTTCENRHDDDASPNA